jgi:hypothetical protein
MCFKKKFMIDWNKVFTYKDGQIYWKEKSSGRSVSNPAGFNDLNDYGVRRRFKYQGVIRFVSRIIWEIHHGVIPDGMVIDHINSDCSDDRIENLRCVTVAFNHRNMRRRSSKKSTPMGVKWYKQTGKWVAQITDNYKYIHLGTFAILDEAIAARKAAERELGYDPNHGKFDLCPNLRKQRKESKLGQFQNQ